MAQVKSHDKSLLERGDIFFLYRPRIRADEAHALRDVERIYLVLKPWRTRKYRMLIVGRKKLPTSREHNRFWAFVWRVFKSRKALQGALGEQDYEIHTRDLRHVPAARPVGEGIYAIVRHGEHTHLTYRLELPRRAGAAVRELNIRHEASYIIAVKNPASREPQAVGLEPPHVVRFPHRLQRKFAGRPFIPLDPPGFLDDDGAELMLIGAAENARAEFGIEFTPDHEDEHTADVLKELRLPRKVAREPLFERAGR